MVVSKRAKRIGAGIAAAVVVAAAVIVGGRLAGQPAANEPAPEQAQEELSEQPAATEPTEQPAAPAPDPAPAATPAQYVLFIGDDAWENYTPGHADLMLLARLDFERHAITFVTVPRDTAYTFPDGHVDKLNQVYTAQGPAAQCAAVSEIVGVDVTQYVCVGFDGLQQIVASFGGLDVDLPYAVTYSFYTKDYPDESFAAGPQTLTPWRTMALTRTRTGYAPYGLEQDMMRQVVNRQLMVNLARLAFADPARTPDLLASLQGFASTNIPLETQQAWARELADAPALTVYTTSGPFTGDIDAASGLWLVTPNVPGWQLLMAAVAAGDDPTAAASTYAAALESSIAPVSAQTTIPLQ